MALTRKFLAALGIEADKVDEIISAHAETVNGLKSEIEKEKAKADQYKDDAGKYANAKDELEKLKKSETDYNTLKAEYDSYKAGVEAKAVRDAKEKAYRVALKDANLTERGIEKALKYADWDKVELDESGKLKDANAHVKTVREDWAEYISKVDVKGAKTPTPPEGGGDQHTPSRAAMVAQKHYEMVYGKKGDSK